MTRAAEISEAFVKSQPASAARALDQVSSADVAAFIGSVGEVEGESTPSMRFNAVAGFMWRGTFGKRGTII